MSLDPRFVGRWERVRYPGTIREIQSSGEYIAHGQPVPYEINAGGTTLTIQPPKGPENFQREGAPSDSLIGLWKRFHPDSQETECLDFKQDGTFENYVEGQQFRHPGSYQDSGTSYTTQEPRGTIRTEGNTYHLAFEDKELLLKYEFEGESTYHLFDPQTDALLASWDKV